ncbi:glycosyltransferase family 2 protein [Allorhizobium sp. BGMRC 0089]|uniref:glycosyltransferase family 2 protein n=1 Tax=Allorhizobium sonneratiae TaxID=2934936 RepID=UPI0020344730|nr:glycosyltransferase family 2 protein [Allorhizobium sonneratiae]MCM2292021.1 glycosyltransferase family 2 protein [Allorhizobium sonneratiae]
MALTLRTSDDLSFSRDQNDGFSQWDATGDDGHFVLFFPLLRHPYLCLELEADHEIDPKLYLPTMTGFRESKTIQLPKGRRFCITVHVGAFGNIRNIRLDPSSFPARFSFRATSVKQAKIATPPEDDIVLRTIGNFPRFHLPIPRFLLGRGGARSLKAFLSTSDKLAQHFTAHETPTSDCWLSLIVPVYNTPVRYLDDLLTSFVSQKAGGAELILVDDCSTDAATRAWLEKNRTTPQVQCLFKTENSGIAETTNVGLAAAQGRWIGFLDHDDIIAPYALKLIHRVLREHPELMFAYTDELIIGDTNKPKGLMLKPAYDPVLLSGVNYINHFSLYRHDRLKELGYLRQGYDGSQDYDMLLRYLDGVAEDRVAHIPYPAYHWRQTGKSYSSTFIDKATANARQAIVDSFARKGVECTVEPALADYLHRPQFAGEDKDLPLISVIIPSRNGYDLIKRVLHGLLHETDYPKLEVIVIDNGSDDKTVLDLYEHLRRLHGNLHILIEKEAFNFARSINKGLRLAKGEHFLLLNNDIEITDPGWLKEMVGCLSYPGTGIVGAKLLYPNGTAQHNGVIIGFGGLAGHWYLNTPEDFGGPMNRLKVRNGLTCVTGAAMLISGDCYRDIGAWDEETFAIAYNDVDYCLRARKAGFRVIWTPFAALTHHESASRGSDEVPEKKARFDREKAALQERHATLGFDDPAINPWYTKTHSDPRLDPEGLKEIAPRFGTLTQKALHDKA